MGLGAFRAMAGGGEVARRRHAARPRRSTAMLERGSSAPASPDASSISSLARIEAAAISAAAPGRRSTYLTRRASASGVGIQASMGSLSSSSSERATSDASPGMQIGISKEARRGGAV